MPSPAEAKRSSEPLGRLHYGSRGKLRNSIASCWCSAPAGKGTLQGCESGVMEGEECKVRFGVGIAVEGMHEVG